MANFSTNQVKQFYVANAVDSNLDTKGDVTFTKVDGDLILNQVGEGGIVKSDFIPISNITYAKGIKAAAMSEYLHSAYIACATPVAGQQYILKVQVREFVGITPEDTCTIIADYKAKSGDTAETVLYELGKILKKNLSKQVWPLLKVYLTTAATGSVTANNCDEIDSATPASESYVGLVLEAAPQDYRRGILAQDNVDFTVLADNIISSGDETAWATITANADHVSAAVLNNNKIKDLEYFCMGERGDIYRGVGFPNNIETKYMVDDQTYGWDIIELGFFFAGNGEDPQKSQKEIVLAIPAPSAYSSDCASYNILEAINTAAGSTIITQVFGA